jgi:hypothetical protein
MKEGLVGLLDIYLGTPMSKVTLAKGVVIWAKSPTSKYSMQEAVWNIKDYLKCQKANLSFKTGYQLELDVSRKLDFETSLNNTLSFCPSMPSASPQPCWGNMLRNSEWDCSG